ncbi:putative zinc-binding protein [Krasilnikovia sp. MM14-A1259]|uniref:putative zinc-binding protein n=1 Tax=Krasilnikovia sp. MM14-A1259 TaxID=3373539 RepID=UPI0038063C08
MSSQTTAPVRRGGRPNDDLPLVYSCSGCSSAAQLANALAIRLDRLGAAEMSCIAGLGGDVPSLLRVARSGRPILALDGCPLVCVTATLRRHGLDADRHVVLSDHGVRKRRHADFDEGDVDRLLPVVAEAAAALVAPAPGNAI